MAESFLTKIPHEILKEVYKAGIEKDEKARSGTFIHLDQTTLYSKINDEYKGKLEMIPPVPVPPKFRGKVAYDRENCIGCQLCYKICPTRAIEWLPEEKKIKIFISRCCFCAQCVDICPVNTLAMTEEFLLSSYDKYADELVITDSGELPGSVKNR